MKTKMCTKCKEVKSVSEFYRRIDCSGYTSHCKECERERYRNYHKRKKATVTFTPYTEHEKLKQWSRDNAEYKEIIDPKTGEIKRIFRNYWEYEE